MREQVIDFQDVQGLVRGYGKSLGHGVFLILRVLNAEKFREFLKALKPPTTMEEWPGGEPPATVTNIAFSYLGLEALGLPADLLATFPEEFKQGMRRAPGHQRRSRHERAGRLGALLDERFRARLDRRLCARRCGVGRAPSGDTWARPRQRVRCQVHAARPSASCAARKATRREVSSSISVSSDGVSDPAIEGVARPEHYAGSKLDKQEREPLDWQPIAPGEFLLGHYKDEADERPVGIGLARARHERHVHGLSQARAGRARLLGRARRQSRETQRHHARDRGADGRAAARRHAARRDQRPRSKRLSLPRRSPWPAMPARRARAPR